jgi:hypothetical protein
MECANKTKHGLLSVPEFEYFPYCTMDREVMQGLFFLPELGQVDEMNYFHFLPSAQKI